MDAALRLGGGRRAEKRFAPDFVSVRGAGGRFIRRADKGKSVAVGLKATDAAAAACRGAAVVSRAAQLRAEADQREEARARRRDGETALGRV